MLRSVVPSELSSARDPNASSPATRVSDLPANQATDNESPGLYTLSVAGTKNCPEKSAPEHDDASMLTLIFAARWSNVYVSGGTVAKLELVTSKTR